MWFVKLFWISAPGASPEILTPLLCINVFTEPEKHNDKPTEFTGESQIEKNEKNEISEKNKKWKKSEKNQE